MEYKKRYTKEEKELITSVGPEGSCCDVGIPLDIKKIPEDIFFECINLKRIVLPNNIEAIEFGAFEGCEKLETVEIPSVRKIMSSAFFNCPMLKEIELSKDIIEIHDETFGGCESLESICLPPSIKRIGMNAFWGCRSLKMIDLPDSIDVIDKQAFSGCIKIEEITLPKNIRKIGDNAFAGCYDLKVAIINSNCQIPESIFNECEKLEKIYVTKEAFLRSHFFTENEKYKDKIEIIKPKSLEDLLDEGKSLREISNIIKEQER